jgi:hypothetical protein
MMGRLGCQGLFKTCIAATSLAAVAESRNFAKAPCSADLTYCRHQGFTGTIRGALGDKAPNREAHQLPMKE